jgi:hypothetical protein
MIPLATSQASTSSPLGVFTPPSPAVDELLEPEGVLDQSERVARGFAKRKGRGTDGAFIDEAIAEAHYIVTVLILTEYESICEKYPDKAERMKFYRCSVGYKLMAYFSHRATSTVSYLKKKGIEVRRHSVHEGMLVEYVSAFDIKVCLEAVCTDALEMRVLEFYSMGNDREQIGLKCGISPKRVRKILVRIRKRLLHPVME